MDSTFSFSYIDSLVEYMIKIFEDDELETRNARSKNSLIMDFCVFPCSSLNQKLFCCFCNPHIIARKFIENHLIALNRSPKRNEQTNAQEDATVPTTSPTKNQPKVAQQNPNKGKNQEEQPKSFKYWHKKKTVYAGTGHPTDGRTHP